MPNDADFQELERRVAELTQRIYRLEQQLATGHRLPGAAPVAPPKSVVKPEQPVVVNTGTSSVPPPPPLSAAIPAETQKHEEQRQRQLESLIGSHLLNRVGIVALMTGAAYFLKLAFDNNWIGPTGRVSIGLLAGIALVFWSSRTHARGYKYFSYSLTAVGIGIMYLSLWASFQLYHLVPGAVAFIAMIVVTVSTGMLALRQDTQIIAAVAVAGGFATPALLSTGQNRPIELFTYIALLNVFAIVLVMLRPWRRLLVGSFIGTVIYYTGWFDEFDGRSQSAIAAGYATLFFLQFAVLPLIKRLHVFRKQQWNDSKTFVLVAVLDPAVYFLELYAIYESADNTGLAWVAVALAAFYIFISKQLADSRPAEPAQTFEVGPLHRWLHLAIGVTFLTIAIPLKLHSHWITMGWFVESAVLIAIGHRAGNTFLKRAAVTALSLGVFRLLFYDDFTTHMLIFNSRFATYALSIAAIFWITWQAREDMEVGDRWQTVASVSMNALALLALNAEVSDYFTRRYQDLFPGSVVPGSGSGLHDWRVARDFTYSALWMIYGAALMFTGFWRKSAPLRWQAMVLVAFTVAKVFLYDLSSLTGPLRVLSFIALGALLMGISFVYQKDWLKLSAGGAE